MIRISRLGWFGITLVLLAPWAVVIWMFGRNDVSVPRADRVDPPAAAAKTGAAANVAAPSATRETREGKWGRLVSRRIEIEPPEEFIPGNYQPVPPRWTFHQASPESLRELWEEAGVSGEQRAELERPERMRVNGDVVVVEPPPELVLDLPAEARGQIYAKLAAFPENGAQREPFRFRTGNLDDWFDRSGLPEDVVALTKRMIYHRHGTYFFSDYDIVIPRVAPAHQTLYLKTLSRKSALLVTLEIERDTDIDALAEYWGRGRRAKDVKPLLQSLARQPDGGSIDIVHLIPRFARSLLYTFPLPSDDADAANRDCHWTSFNFYRDLPDERFTAIEFVKQTLLNEYFPVAGEPQLGDIIMFVQPGGVVVHSCVYIAGDIVFTKNGPSFAVPWQFAHLESVLSFYSVGDAPMETRRYRSKAQ